MIFIFGVLHPVARKLSRLLEELSLATTFLRCLFIFISQVHVSALAGHLQVEYTIIFGKLPHYNGSVAFVLYLFCIWFDKYWRHLSNM
jgi:hypothetical protein